MAFLQRFRSGDRDRATDDARIGTVLAAISTALAETRREQDGLRRRAERAGSDAAFLVEGDSPETGGGQVGRAEGTMRQAERRLAALDRQIAGFEAVLRQVDALRTPP